jgi:L-ascorbate metabolism protein UlaG (beta-lactamase superfamily)
MIKILTVFVGVFLSISSFPHCRGEEKNMPTALCQTYYIKDATVWFFGHCGFAVQTSNHFLIFDYVEKRLENSYPKPVTLHLATGYINQEEIKNLKVRVFVTHEHGDHYDPVIFEWEKNIPDIQYFFGWQASNKPQYHYMLVPRAEWKTDDLEIYTINSHHSGVPEVAYLMKVDSLVIYHNGDYRGNYQEDMPYMKSKPDSIDLAFTSCVWQEQWEYSRINFELITQFQPMAVFPMHVRVGDEDQYFALFQNIYQSLLQEGQIILTNNTKGAKFLYKDGIIITK